MYNRQVFYFGAFLRANLGYLIDPNTLIGIIDNAKKTILVSIHCIDIPFFCRYLL